MASTHQQKTSPAKKGIIFGSGSIKDEGVSQVGGQDKEERHAGATLLQINVASRTSCIWSRASITQIQLGGPNVPHQVRTTMQHRCPYPQPSPPFSHNTTDSTISIKYLPHTLRPLHQHHNNKVNQRPLPSLPRKSSRHNRIGAQQTNGF
jgi:hypothetical protein